MQKKLISCFLLCAMLCGCAKLNTAAPKTQEASKRYLQSMDTVMQLTAYGENRESALDAAESEILRLDDLLSTGKETSEVSQMNRQGSRILSEDTAYLVERSRELYESTGGLFDITIYPLTGLWGFPTKAYHVPTETELDAVLPLVNASQITYSETDHRLTLRQGQSIDLGGIAKGYTSQRVMELFQKNGITSGMVSLGGNVQCLGNKPDGSAWKIGITDPWNKEYGIYAVVQVADEAVITSGGYERFFTDEETGTVYRHILDPRTGYPAENDLASVSIISSDGTLADGLSTSLYIMGLEGACEYWRAHSDQFQVILITNDGTIYVSEGLYPRVTSEHTMETIQR